MPDYPALSCPCCGEPMPPRPTQRGKPHYICDPCGVQLFVRRQEGIERLLERHGGRRRPQKGGALWNT